MKRVVSGILVPIWIGVGVVMAMGGVKGETVAPGTQGTPKIPVVQERDGLPNVFAKLRDGKPVTIVWFGGSITAGAGASKAEDTSYRGRVGHWFEATFPNSKVTNVNAAIGGTGSDLGAFRLSRDVLPYHPDLVFVEYAVNDGGAPEVMIDRSMEGIVRQIRNGDRGTDICFVYTFVVGQLPEFKAGTLTRAVQRDEVVAEHYGIPSVNMAVPAAQKLTDGTMTTAEFSKDGVHPTDAGYAIYADALEGFLQQQQQAARPAADHALPAPLREDSLDHTHMISPQEMFPTANGWTLQTKSPVGDFKSLLVASDPGSQQTVKFGGPILAMFYILGPDTGSFDYKIDDGDWKTMDPFDQWAKQYYRAHYRLLADGLPNTAHTVTIRIRAEHSPDSKGTITRLGYLLDNPPA